MCRFGARLRSGARRARGWPAVTAGRRRARIAAGVGGACDDGARKAVVRPWSNVLAVEHRRHADAGHRKQPDFPASPLHAQYLCVPPESCPRWLPPLKAC